MNTLPLPRSYELTYAEGIALRMRPYGPERYTPEVREVLLSAISKVIANEITQRVWK